MSVRSRWAVSTLYMLRSLGFSALAAGCMSNESAAPAVGVAVAALTEIDSCAELQAIRNDRDGDYVLTTDVDCSAYDFGDNGGFMPIGQGGNVWEPFTGTFDGQGHVISGLTIDRPQHNGVGLFGLLYEAEVRRVGIEDASINGHAWVGALAGTALDSIVERSYSTGDVHGQADTGGLIGQVKGDGSEVRDCYSRADVTASSTPGLVFGEVSYGGGVTRVYSAGTSSHDGMIAGDVALSGSVADSFFDCTVAGNCAADGASMTSGMHDDTQYVAASWDLAAVWGWRASGYPCLRWEPGCGDGCATRIPHYETACLDDLEEDANETAALATPAYGDLATDYPTLGSDVLPTPPTLPTPEGTATAGTLAELESAVNAGNVTVTATANIDGRADLYGENVVLDLNGYRVDQLALSGDGFGNATGGAHRLEIRNGIVGSINHDHDTDIPSDITLRGLTVANDLATTLENDATIRFGGSAGMDRVLIVSCVVMGHASEGPSRANAPFAGNNVRDMIVANSNLGAYLSNEIDDAGWVMRHGNGARWLIVDSWLRADHNPALRTRDDGFVVWTTPSHRGDARRATVINHNHPHLRTDSFGGGGGANDRSLDLFVKYVVGNAYNDAVVYGGRPEPGMLSPLFLARGLDVIQQTSGIFDGAVLTALQSGAGGGSWDYDVNGENTYGTSWAIPDAPDICDYLDRGDTICPSESDPYSVVP